MPNWINNKPLDQSNQQRKRWNLEDKNSLTKLKNHLAEDGSPDVQFDLGRQLLDEASDSDPLNQVKGVQWLFRAAEKGHEQAIVLLNHCFRHGRGITSMNSDEIRKFLELSSGARAARRAAQELFLTMANGNDYVTVEQLERRIREIYNLRKRKKSNQTSNEIENEEDDQGFGEGSVSINGDSNSSSPNRTGHRAQILDESNYISEANLLSAAVNYSNGQMPSISQAIQLSVPHPQSLDHIPVFHRPFFHPIMFLLLLYHRLISLISTFPDTSPLSPYIFVVLLIYTAVSSDNFLLLFPISGYFASIIVMVVASFKMLKTKHEYIDFRMWSGLFLNYGDEHVDTEDSENQYLKNNMKPYFYFFAAFALNLLLYPLIHDHQWLPHSEITVIAFFLTFTSMIAFMYSTKMPDFLILFSFGLNVLAKYPYEMDSVVTNSWRFLDLKVPGFSTFVIGNGIEFCLNCRGLLYLLIPAFMTLLGRRRNWHGIYQHLIPHCVTLSWLQLTIISSQSATMFGLVRSALGIAGVLFFLPLFGIVTLLIPVFAAVEWLKLTDSTNKICATVATGFIAIIGSCFMAVSNRTGKYVTFLQVLICLMATLFLTYPYMTSSENLYSSYLQQAKHISEEKPRNEATLDDMDDERLNWEMFHRYCMASKLNQIHQQVRCSHLKDTKIHWEGVVADVDISDINNWQSDMLQNYLPRFVSRLIICYLGDKNEVNCLPNEDCENIKDFIENQKKCNIDIYNTYEYEIQIKMEAPTSGISLLSSKTVEKITLKAQHTFGNFTARLRASDRIWFKGTIKNSLLSNVKKIQMNSKVESINKKDDHLKARHHIYVIEIDSVGCVSCADKELEAISIKYDFKMRARIRDFNRGFKYFLNVLFNPLVTFK